MKQLSNSMMAVVTILGLSAGVTRAGNTNSPAAPTDAASAMYTLEQIYNKLDNQGYNHTNVKRTGAFTEPATGPANTMHTLDEIMALVLSRSPVVKGQAGCPVGITPPSLRFVRESDVVGSTGYSNVIDRVTGLMWTDNTAPGGNMPWADAVTYCNNLVWGGYDDWRMPTRAEVWSVAAVSVSPALPTAFSTWVTPQRNPTTAYSLDNNAFHNSTGSLKTLLLNVWPVRGGQP